MAIDYPEHSRHGDRILLRHGDRPRHTNLTSDGAPQLIVQHHMDLEPHYGLLPQPCLRVVE